MEVALRHVLTLAMVLMACVLSAQPIIVDDFSPQCRLEGVWADNKSNGYSGGGTVGDRFHYTSGYAPFKKTGREKAYFTPELPNSDIFRTQRGEGQAKATSAT